MGVLQEGVSAGDKEAAEGSYLCRMSLENSKREGHNYSNQVGRRMESP